MINPNVRATAGVLESQVRAGLENARDNRPARRPTGDEVPPTSEASEGQAATAEVALKKGAPLPEVHLRELSIRVSPETNRVVIEVIDSETKDVVRKIPPEEALDLLRSLPQRRALFVDREG